MCFAQCSWTYIVSLEAEFQIQRETLSCLTQTGEGFLFEFKINVLLAILASVFLVVADTVYQSQRWSDSSDSF